MNIKYLQIRDCGTHIPALAVKLENNRVVRRAGFGDGVHILLINLNTYIGQYDFYQWKGRTMREAHDWIIENWEDIKNEDVIDVEYILGESDKKKVFEI